MNILQQKKYMSTINNNLQAVSFSPLNTSKSKQMFSFTKAVRFFQFNESGTSIDTTASPSFYDKPSTLSKRSASFGYGSKSSFINKFMNNPSPDKYEKLSDFQNSKKKGITIAFGRENCKNISIFKTNSSPGPCDYNCKNNKQNSVAYSLRNKLKLPQIIATPGPGRYNSDKIEKENGSSFISKFKSSQSFKIPRSQYKSTDKIQYPGLGPTTYTITQPSSGKQLLSKKKTQKSFYFDKRPRITMSNQSLSLGPGPGAYNFFSEFNR